ncbi:MAG: Ig-like domain-containing protein, partial [Pirellulales bacterium]|nr:Ig-like domain-containing protein [Pirellulales bacterium]
TIVDDGAHEFPVGSPLSPDTAPEIASAIVHLTVNPANDLPVFDLIANVDILERDDNLPTRIDNFITNVAGGPQGSALDEQSPTQTVSFTITQISSSPAGLMTRDPDVSSGSFIEFFPAPDQFGVAVYEVVGTDNGSPNQAIRQTFTVNVRPVNDAPRFDPTVAGTSDVNIVDSDIRYSVANFDFNNDGMIDDATITYTLREDNTQQFADTSTPFFIPLTSGPPAPGFQQVGLLDVFTVGPDNEAAALPGGSQTLELFSFGNPATGGSGFRTDLGGLLTPVFSGSTLVGLEYTPPANFNNVIGASDSFTYQVRDDSATGGETFDLVAGTLVPDRLTATNRVLLNLLPVNDRPVFDVAATSVEVPEDSAPLAFSNFAFNINAGPPTTAFDEVSLSTGQSVNFTVRPLDFDLANAADFFTVFPSVNRDTGQLDFQPAPDVFGEFNFEIVLIDNGPGDLDGSNFRGDITASLPTTLTIDVQPTNDPPAVDPTAAPLQFTLLEDGSVEILVTGDNTTRGLLDVFTPGPANESADILPLPGGNQTVSLTAPLPVTSAAGGSIQAVRDPGTNEVVRLIYRPRPDFVGTDSFIYTVTDDGQSINIGTGGTPFNDPRIAANTVTFEVLPVNDAPQFSGAGNVDSDEDQGVVVIDAWANNVQAGPLTATDEINGLGLVPPQSLVFVFNQVSPNTDLFITPPSAVINGDSASLTYETAPDANGVAVFEVFLRDGGPTDAGIGDEFESPVVTFLIDVAAVNDPPEFTAGPDIVVDEDSGPFNSQWATGISPGPADEASQSVQFLVNTPAVFASLFLSEPTISDEGVLRFTPASNANTENINGPALIEVTAIDSEGGQAQTETLTITINEVNDPPVAQPDEITTDEDTILTITSAQLLANDVDPDLLTNINESLTIVLPEQSFSIGGAEVNFDPVSGEVTYNPLAANDIQALKPNESLVDSFSYSVRDASGVISGQVTVGLTINGVNDAPAVTDDEVDLDPDNPTVIRPLDNDTDIDGIIQLNSIMVTLQPAFGSVQIAPDGTLTYTPFANFAIEDQFRYTVADDLGARSEEALVTISANARPVAVDDAAGTFLDEAIDINVAVNDSDPDGTLDLSSIVIVTQPTRGEAVAAPGGIVRYLPDPGFVGSDSFEYQILDNEGRASNVATVNTQVVASRLQNPDMAPDVNDDGFITALDALLVINLLARTDGQLSIPVLPTDQGPNFFDVNGNQSISAVDAVVVINELARVASDLGRTAGEQVATTPIAQADSSETDLGSKQPAADEPEVVADALKAVDATSVPEVASDVIDLIAEDRDDDKKSDESVAALDAAMADVL